MIASLMTHLPMPTFQILQEPDRKYQLASLSLPSTSISSQSSFTCPILVEFMAFRLTSKSSGGNLGSCSVYEAAKRTGGLDGITSVCVH